MIVETLDDWNTVIEGCSCCPMPDFLGSEPDIDIEIIQLNQNSCFYFEINDVNGGSGRMRRTYFNNTDTIYNSAGDIVDTGSLILYFDKRWNGTDCEETYAILQNDQPTTPSLFGTHLVITTNEAGVPPADYTKTVTRKYYKFWGTASEYLLYEDVDITQYLDFYANGVPDFPNEIRGEMQAGFDALVFPDDATTGFAAISAYSWRDDFVPDVTLQKARYRWDITTHTGSWFKITWDVAFYPRGGGAAQPFLLDQTWEWTGAAGGPPSGSEDSWKSDWYDLEPPEDLGEHKIVNIRYSGYRSTKIGTPINVTGIAEDYT